MSILLDKLLEMEFDSKILVNGGKYIAKPMNKDFLIIRIKDAYKVLTGKAFAVHYLEDCEDMYTEIESNYTLLKKKG